MSSPVHCKQSGSTVCIQLLRDQCSATCVHVQTMSDIVPWQNVIFLSYPLRPHTCRPVTLDPLHFPVKNEHTATWYAMLFFVLYNYAWCPFLSHSHAPALVLSGTFLFMFSAGSKSLLVSLAFQKGLLLIETCV